jgi:RNA recognition motif-containing protein
MGKKLYVGNLAYRTTEEQVRELFAQVGEVESVSLITDRETGRAKGFGFVEMSTEEASQEAIKREERSGGNFGGSGYRSGNRSNDRYSNRRDDNRRRF